MSNVRKKIMKLAREKFEQGYYKPISASTPHHHGKSRKISLTATELPTRKQSINRKLSVHKFLQDKENLVPRPHHSIFLSMYEGAEWVIFKEKFCDWPDESRIIRMKGGPQTVGVLAKVCAVYCSCIYLLSSFFIPLETTRMFSFKKFVIDGGLNWFVAYNHQRALIQELRNEGIYFQE